MAFAIRDLSVLAYANGFTLWHYKAGDELQRVVASDEFFNDASDMMTVGDTIMVSFSDGRATIRSVVPSATSVVSIATAALV